VFDTLMTRCFSFLGRSLCRFRGSPVVDALARYTDAFRRRLENVNFDIETNGEMRVLKLLRLIGPHCAFDVGAHEGDWTRRMLDVHPQCTVHAFEPVPQTFRKLEQATQSLSGRIVLNGYGLSDKNERMDIYYSDEDTSTATGYPIRGMTFHDQYYSSHTQCTFRKAADYIREYDIEQIDFLKIDVEGMELQVIKGFEDELRRVRVIQFEFGIFNISSHVLLYDFYTYLDRHGFVMGKIYPTDVVFFQYHYDREAFSGNNYVAVRNNERELIRCLSDRKVKS
jgi:FkbM family methyltransferase